MAFGPYQHVGFAYQGIGDQAYQIGKIGSGVLVCLASGMAGSGTVTHTGSSPASRPNYIILDPKPITHRL